MVIRQLVLTAIFVALAVALGLALIHLPNVELITLVVFMSGFRLGTRRGFFIGLCAMSLFTFCHPLGVPLPPVAAAQVGGMAAIGSAGGLVRRWVLDQPVWAKLALVGLLATLLYDLITNTALALALGLGSKMSSVLLAGLSFALLHVISNVAIFALAGPLIIRIGPSGTLQNSLR